MTNKRMIEKDKK